MTPAHDDRDTTGQPPLTDLMAKYIQRQTGAHASGLAPADLGAVELHEAVPVQSVDPRQAWDEATAAVRDFGAIVAKSPADWPQLVAGQESQTALPMAVGHYPQLVRDLAPLFHAEKLSDLAKEPGPALAVGGLTEWAEAAGRSGEFAKALAAVGVLRLARRFDSALAVLKASAAAVPVEGRAAWGNEEAALLWQTGRRDEAARRWQELPETVPVLFNRGMAALFLDRPAEARAALRAAVERLPESSGWHHLGRLYLALAES